MPGSNLNSTPDLKPFSWVLQTALQDEQQMGIATSDNLSLVTVNIHSDRLPRFSLQLTALDVAALQEKEPIERQEEFKMQVRKDPKCGPTWSGLEEQGGQVGSPGGAQSSSTQMLSSHQCLPPLPMCHQHKALGSPCLSALRRQRVSTISHGSFISLYLCLQMFMSAAGGAFQVLDSNISVVALMGRVAELPYTLLPPQNVESMQIRCSRCPSSHRCPSSQVVYVYEDGRDKPEEAMKEYVGRTKLVRDVKHNRSVILKIDNVQLSDSGWYRCFFEHGSFYSAVVIRLTVAALGSTLDCDKKFTWYGQIQLVCKSEGWFPQPNVQWIDSEGREIPAEPETHIQNKGGLFHVKTSQLLWGFTKKNLICRIRNPALNQTKEKQVSITGADCFITASIITSYLVLLMLILVPIFLYRKWHKNSSTILPGLCHRITQAVQPQYVPAPNADPADDDLNSVATDGNVNTAATAIAPANTHDTVHSEASANPTQDPYLADAATMDTFLTTDSGSANAYDSEAHDSAYFDSCDSIFLAEEACECADVSYTVTEVRHQLQPKHDLQREVEMQVFGLNQQTYNPEYC